MPKGVKVVQYFGMSYDEPRRVSKVKNRFVGHPWAEGRFPLFGLEMTSTASQEWLSVPRPTPYKGSADQSRRREQNRS